MAAYAAMTVIGIDGKHNFEVAFPGNRLRFGGSWFQEPREMSLNYELLDHYRRVRDTNKKFIDLTVSGILRTRNGPFLDDTDASVSMSRGIIAEMDELITKIEAEED